MLSMFVRIRYRLKLLFLVSIYLWYCKIIDKIKSTVKFLLN